MANTVVTPGGGIEVVVEPGGVGETVHRNIEGLPNVGGTLTGKIPKEFQETKIRTELLRRNLTSEAVPKE
jgi:hypothetical protein